LNRTGLAADEINWDSPILDQHAMALRTQLDPTFRYAFLVDRTEHLCEWMEMRVFGEHANVVMENIGRTGTGKSYTNMTLACQTDAKFSPKRNIHYSIETILNSPYKSEEPISWMLDELARSWGIGSWRSTAEWENYIESIRKKQHSVFTATPTRKPLGTTMWCLEPMRMSREDEVVQASLSNDKRHTLGYVIISAPWHYLKRSVVEEYEDMKDEYLMKVLLRKGSDSTGDRIGELMKDFNFGKTDQNGIMRVTLDGTVLTTQDILELVNQKFPHLQRNNEAYAIAEGIKSRMKLRDLSSVKPQGPVELEEDEPNG